MEINELEQRKHELELVRDKLWNELAYIDGLMRQVGFTNGLETVKATVEELLLECNKNDPTQGAA